jgi:predicted RNA-binding Zn-ribbon protein involved in translation (DUF1610 family)
MIPTRKLRELRNRVPIDRVLAAVDLPLKHRDGYLRFLCPLCGDFHTATNPRTNLARCFRCKRNFNTIDLVMVVEQRSFLAAVDRLRALLER